MFDHFFETCVAAVSVSNAEKLKRMKDLNRRNTFDQARTGSLGIKPKFVTEILGDKKDAEAAMHIVRTMR